MEVNLLEPFFSLTQPEFGAQVIYGSSHFFHRVQSSISWSVYNEIIPSSNGRGSLTIGQIPIDDFHDDLLKKLPPKALVVSCTEGFELAGIGTRYKVIPPYTWSHYGIDHHHLPFTDFSADSSFGLIIDTLEKMKTVHRAGDPIYIHCKAGRGRSGIVAVLFYCLTNDELLKKLSEDHTQAGAILDAVISHLQKTHPQLKIGSKKKSLGLSVLNYYTTYWNDPNSSENSDSFGLFAKQNHIIEQGKELSPCDYLRTISQSPGYKFIIDQAYKNPDIFHVIQKFLGVIYEGAKAREGAKETIFDVEIGLKTALASMSEKSEQKILLSLYALYNIKNEFTNVLATQPQLIRDLGFELCNKIIDSTASYEQKINWLGRTRDCLADPSNKNIDEYIIAANNALNTGNVALRTIGLVMLLVGIAFITITLIASCTAGGILAASLVITAGVSFGGLGLGLGSALYGLGKSDGVADASKHFISMVKSERADANSTNNDENLSVTLDTAKTQNQEGSSPLGFVALSTSLQ
ncbi:MAG: protein-tyrosine phosphatase family protein [Legionella sp.]